MGGLRSYSVRTLALGPVGSWEEGRGPISVPALFMMSKLHLAKGLFEVLGVSIPIGNSKESKESPGSTWPKDIIALEPGLGLDFLRILERLSVWLFQGLYDRSLCVGRKEVSCRM